jgi:hypothetical protein
LGAGAHEVRVRQDAGPTPVRLRAERATSGEWPSSMRNDAKTPKHVKHNDRRITSQDM